MVAHDQRVRELEAELPPEGARALDEPVRHLERLAPLQVPLEVLRPRLDVAVAEDVVEEPVDRVSPEERGVELHGDVKAHLLHEEDGHRLDLVRRAAVEGRKRHLVGERRPEVEVPQATQLVRDLPAHGLDLGPRVLHRGDPGPHRGRADAGEVVAHAQVEDGLVARRVVRPSEQPFRARDVDQHRALHVLAQALGEAQLLAPLHVVAHGLHVDAGPRDREAVVHLDRLELDEAPAREPGEQDVLGHLPVGPGGGPDGVGRAVAVDADRRGRGPPRPARSVAPGRSKIFCSRSASRSIRASRCGKGAGTSSATRGPPRG